MNIPSSMPFRIEIWNPEGSRLEETLLASSHLLLAAAAFDEACRHRPRSLVRLRNLSLIVRQSVPDPAIKPRL